MSVPLTLLGLLERGPSHGYDLKRDYDAYFGQGRPLRYSQVYATLSRLARDGKAVAGPVEQGAGPERRRYIITDEGVADVEKWLAEPAPPEPDLQSELFAKVVLALMLGKHADSYLDVQRAAHLQRMRESGQFRYVKEAVMHHVELGSADRLVGLWLSQGGVATLLKGGLTEEQIGLPRLRAAVEGVLGTGSQPWYWSYRVRFGIR